MKICAITASGKGEGSNTYRAIKDIIACEPKTVEVEYINLWEKSISNCKECLGCFENGVCPLDSEAGDDGEKIKERILEADYLIIGTGVFLHNINSSLSILLERIGMWTHIMKLAGKKCTIVISTSTNGHMNVAAYLNKIATYLGMQVVEIVVFTSMEFMNKEYYAQLVKNSAKKIYDSLIENCEFVSTDKQEEFFNSIKLLYTRGAFSPYERKCWGKKNLLEYETFKDYVDSNVVGTASKN